MGSEFATTETRSEIPNERVSKPAEDDLFEDDASAGGSIFSPRTKEEQLPRLVASMKRQLDLDDDQVKELRAILKKAVKRNSWIRENLQDDPTLRSRRMRQSFRLLDRQITNVLNDEQLVLYKEMKKKRKEAAKRRRDKKKPAK